MTEEKAFLAAILERPADDATKLIYADWLEEQGDPRAEFLRLMVQARQERVVTPEQRRRHNELAAELAELTNQGPATGAGGQRTSLEFRERRRRILELRSQLAELRQQLRWQIPARLQELSAVFDPNWLAVVSDAEIEACGKGTGEGLPMRFDFICDKTWADLKPTDDGTVRHCDSCDKHVHFCDNLADAREHSQGGRCIAVDLGIIRREDDLRPRGYLLGRPSKEAVRQIHEEDVDPVSQARLDARKPARNNRIL